MARRELTALAVALATAGCGSSSAGHGTPTPGAAKPVDVATAPAGAQAVDGAAAPVGEPNQGSVVQYADCADWTRGTRAEKQATIVALRGQLTPQRSRTAASAVSDDRAYDVIEKSCTQSGLETLRLYQIYVHVQAYAPLTSGRDDASGT